MVKTTVYLPDDLKGRVTQVATHNRCSEADVIRTALEQYTAAQAPPRPQLPLFESGKPDLVERIDDYLEGFGRD